VLPDSLPNFLAFNCVLDDYFVLTFKILQEHIEIYFTTLGNVILSKIILVENNVLCDIKIYFSLNLVVSLNHGVGREK